MGSEVFTCVCGRVYQATGKGTVTHKQIGTVDDTPPPSTCSRCGEPFDPNMTSTSLDGTHADCTPPTGLEREALREVIVSVVADGWPAEAAFIDALTDAILAALPQSVGVDDDALKLEIAGLNMENCNLRDERQAMLKEISGLKDTRTELANEVLRLRNVVYDTGFRDGKPKESDLLTKARAVVAADDRLEREADGSRLCRDERQRFVLFNAIDALREVVEEKNETTNNPLPEKGNP